MNEHLDHLNFFVDISTVNYVLNDHSCLHFQGSKPLTRPENWGGYRVIPDCFEFWQGQSNRIHDRLRFRIPESGEKLDPAVSIEGENGWILERLSP